MIYCPKYWIIEKVQKRSNNKKMKKDIESDYIINRKRFINESFIAEEIKSLQRSLALLRQDLPQMVNDELIKFYRARQERR
jgi:hypothetical protein